MNDRKNTLPDTYKTKPDVPQTEPLRKAVQNARRLRRKKRYTLLASFFMVAAFAAIGFFAFFELSKHSAVTPKAQGTVTPQTNADLTVSGSAVNTVQNEEMRGVWIASTININYPSEPGLSMAQLKAELDDIVKNTSEAGLNAIFFQVRPTSDSLYPSKIFPYSKYVSGTQGQAPDGNFDSLAYLLEKAGAAGIAVHAWVNPYRVTMYASDEAALCDTNPAKLHPEYTVKYADGKTYYNPALPEVRTLVADGVRELAENYPTLAGIHFDDYFYPYPKNGEDFDDAAAYAVYGGGMDKAAWRRENVNMLIKASYDAVKAVNPNIKFGVSPFGIWANDGSDTPEKGSTSSGLEAYSSLYCDALAWAKGGYVDYLIPQLYWSFATKAAPFDNMARWWNAALDGTGVTYYIGHAAYKAPDYAENEIGIQVEFARNLLCYRGSVFYGYEDIKNNTCSLKDKLAALYAKPVVYTENPSESAAVYQPYNNANSTSPTVTLVGSSDTRYPLTVNGEKISRTKSGLFSYYGTVTSGINVFTLVQNGVSTTHNITYKATRNASSSMQSFSKMEVIDVSPADETWLSVGDTLKISCAAPAGSKVIATVGGMSVELTTKTGASSAKYTKAIYTGELTPNAFAGDGKTVSLGTLMVTATLGKETASKSGGVIKQMGANALIYAEVTNNYSYLKIAPNSSFYDDYTPASVGLRDYVKGLSDGYYKLAFGGYVAKENVKLVEGVELNRGKVLSVHAKVNGTDTVNNKNNFTDVTFACLENVPVNAVASAGKITVTFYNSDPTILPAPVIEANPLISKITAAAADDTTLVYTIHLKDELNAYGYNVIYQNGNIIVRMNNPQTLSGDPSHPLAGKTIVIDPGHGGSDSGALGCGKTNEAMLNLDIALHLRDKLTALGATVLMTRSDNTTVSLEERMAFLNEANPDLAVSIHQNSIAASANAQKIRGYLGLYSTEAGKLLAKNVSKTVSAELNRYERPYAYQKLAVARNHRFPSTLCEMCFISNVEEYEWSITPGNTERSAAAVANGILAYYAAQEVYLAY